MHLMQADAGLLEKAPWHTSWNAWKPTIWIFPIKSNRMLIWKKRYINALLHNITIIKNSQNNLFHAG